MAVTAKLMQLLKKLGFKKFDHHDYWIVEDENEDKEKRRHSKGFIPIYVGEERRKFLVRPAVVNFPAMLELLDKHHDKVGNQGAVALPACSTEEFESILHQFTDQTS